MSDKHGIQDVVNRRDAGFYITGFVVGLCVGASSVGVVVLAMAMIAGGDG